MCKMNRINLMNFTRKRHVYKSLWSSDCLNYFFLSCFLYCEFVFVHFCCNFVYCLSVFVVVVCLISCRALKIRFNKHRVQNKCAILFNCYDLNSIFSLICLAAKIWCFSFENRCDLAAHDLVKQLKCKVLNYAFKIDKRSSSFNI